MVNQSPPPLAQYKDLSDYNPGYGDFVVWSGWFSTWHGIVSDYDNKSGDLYIIFAGVPFLLLTMTEAEQQKETKQVPLSRIKNASKGTWAINRHDATRNANIWYI